MCHASVMARILENMFDEPLKQKNISFPPHVRNKIVISEWHHSNRTWRRNSDTRLIEKGVDRRI